MMTAKQCRACAADLDRRTAECGDSDLREQLRQMGETWRYIALQAEWQDDYTARQAEKPLQ